MILDSGSDPRHLFDSGSDSDSSKQKYIKILKWLKISVIPESIPNRPSLIEDITIFQTSHMDNENPFMRITLYVESLGTLHT